MLSTLKVFVCGTCAKAGRDDYDFCRNCVLGRHCVDCVKAGFCTGLTREEVAK